MPAPRHHAPRLPPGLHYDAEYLTAPRREAILDWLSRITPLWEQRYSHLRAPPDGQPQRGLLRPVYWLGNWQFACLDYYHPPHGVLNRCVAAEPFPRVLAEVARDAETIARRMFRSVVDLPYGWELNTCLVNLYGRRLVDGAWVDTARVGEHRDFEPGPVASLSLGERALFQFVTSQRPGERDGVVSQQWLDDGSLQIFGGDRWKRRTFHRVQRVDTRDGHRFELKVRDFETRRINFTFRYVPREHVVPFAKLSAEARADVEGYVATLAQTSEFFRQALGARTA